MKHNLPCLRLCLTNAFGGNVKGKSILNLVLVLSLFGCGRFDFRVASDATGGMKLSKHASDSGEVEKFSYSAFRKNGITLSGNLSLIGTPKLDKQGRLKQQATLWNIQNPNTQLVFCIRDCSKGDELPQAAIGLDALVPGERVTVTVLPHFEKNKFLVTSITRDPLPPFCSTLGTLADRTNSGLRAAPSSARVARLNPNDKTREIQLSSDQWTVHLPCRPFVVLDSIRADVGHQMGKWYWEAIINSRSSSYLYIGMGGPGVERTEDITLQIGPGFGIIEPGCGYGYSPSNHSEFIRSFNLKCMGQSAVIDDFVLPNAQLSSGTIVGVAADLDNGTISFSRNGTWLTYHPHVNPISFSMVRSGMASRTELLPMIAISHGDSVSVNFGQRSFYYQVPAGYNRGWYE